MQFLLFSVFTTFNSFDSLFVSAGINPYNFPTDYRINKGQADQVWCSATPECNVFPKTNFALLALKFPVPHNFFFPLCSLRIGHLSFPQATEGCGLVGSDNYVYYLFLPYCNLFFRWVWHSWSDLWDLTCTGSLAHPELGVSFKKWTEKC